MRCSQIAQLRIFYISRTMKFRIGDSIAVQWIDKIKFKDLTGFSLGLGSMTSHGEPVKLGHDMICNDFGVTK